MANQFATQVAFNFEEKDSNATLGAINRYLDLFFLKLMICQINIVMLRKLRF